MNELRPVGTPSDEEFRRELVSALPHLRAFARGLTGRIEQADDLVQETAAKAWAARGSFHAGTNLRAWTFTIMRNQFLNQLRKSRRETQLDDETAQASLVTGAAQEGVVQLGEMQRALSQLPQERREAVLLVGASGFSYEEAAEICGVPIGTMKSRVARGRAMLSELLGEG